MSKKTAAPKSPTIHLENCHAQTASGVNEHTRASIEALARASEAHARALEAMARALQPGAANLSGFHIQMPPSQG